MCWLRSVVKAFTPDALPHQKASGSVDTSVTSWGLGEKTFSPSGNSALATRHP